MTEYCELETRVFHTSSKLASRSILLALEQAQVDPRYLILLTWLDLPKEKRQEPLNTDLEGMYVQTQPMVMELSFQTPSILGRLSVSMLGSIRWSLKGMAGAAMLWLEESASGYSGSRTSLRGQYRRFSCPPNNPNRTKPLRTW